MTFLTNGPGFVSELFVIQETTKNTPHTIYSNTENHVTNFDVEGFFGTKQSNFYSNKKNHSSKTITTKKLTSPKQKMNYYPSKYFLL